MDGSRKAGFQQGPGGGKGYAASHRPRGALADHAVEQAAAARAHLLQRHQPQGRLVLAQAWPPRRRAKNSVSEPCTCSCFQENATATHWNYHATGLVVRKV